MSTENERERAQLERAALPDDGMKPAILIAYVSEPTAHGFQFRGLRLATAAEIAAAVPKPPAPRRQPSRGPRGGRN